MTEADWLASDDPAAMLRHLRVIYEPGPVSEPGHQPAPQVSDRKLRLFAAACCRQVWGLLQDDAPCPYCQDADFSTGDHGGPVMGGSEPYASRAKAYWAKQCACGGTRRLNRSRRAVCVAERYADGEATWEELEQAAIEDAIATVGLHGWAGEPFLQDAVQAAIYTSRYFTTAQAGRVAPALQAALLRDVAGNPFRPVALPYRCRGCGISCGGPPAAGWFCHNCGADEALCPWLTPTIVSLAEAAYLERLPPAACGRCGGERHGWGGVFRQGEGVIGGPCPDCHGTGEGPSGLLDPARLLVLADALEDAGCTDEALLRHLRGWEPCLTCLGGKRPCHTCAGARWIPSTGPPLSGPHVRGCFAVDLVLGKS